MATPTNAVVADMLSKLAGSAATLAKIAGSENELALVKSSFAPARGLTIDDLVLATFAGGEPILVTPGPQQIGYDPTRSQWFIDIVSPVGGWYYEATVKPTPGETVYGAALTSKDGVALYGTMLLPAPVSVNEIGDSVTVGSFRFYESDL